MNTRIQFIVNNFHRKPLDTRAEWVAELVHYFSLGE